MATHRSKDADINRSPPNHSVGFGSRRWLSVDAFLIFPRSVFRRAKLLKRGVSPDDVELFGEQADQLSNLQLLEGLPNQEKSDLDFQQWLNKNHPGKGERTQYLSRNYIPDIDLSIANFREFIDKRQKLL